jgi:TRAP-type C4-dicarboxylate transport system substrate-binding protein
MKRLVAFSVALGLMFGAFAFCGTANAAKVIKIAGMKAEGEPETIGMHKFGDYLEQLSNGKYKVKVYPNSTLGKEDKYIADTRRGTVEMCATCIKVILSIGRLRPEDG